MSEKTGMRRGLTRYGDEDFALSAQAAGLSYEQLIKRILSLGIRYHATWR